VIPRPDMFWTQEMVNVRRQRGESFGTRIRSSFMITISRSMACGCRGPFAKPISAWARAAAY